jgi:hypothetical protein
VIGREYRDPGVAIGRWRELEQQVAPLGVTVSARKWLFWVGNQWIALLRRLVTQSMDVGACANSQDCAIARRRPGRCALVLGFAEPTSLAGRLAGSSAARSRAVPLVATVTRVGAKQLQATFAFTAIPTSHRVPPARDATLVKRRVASAGGLAWARYPLTHMLVPAI